MLFVDKLQHLGLSVNATIPRYVFCMVIAAPAFASNFQSGADDILGCTKHGRVSLGTCTDMIDGWIARQLNLKSSFGAKLDSIADYIFVIAVLAKVLPAVQVPEWLWIWIGVIAFIKLTNLVSSLVMFHRIVPVHTVMNKVTGFVLFLLPFGFGAGSWQALTIAEIVACSVATFAAIQEGHFIRRGKEIE